MKLYSDAFLNDSYLKYVGWTMHDKVSQKERFVTGFLWPQTPVVGQQRSAFIFLLRPHSP